MQFQTDRFNSRRRDREFGVFTLVPGLAAKGGGGGSSGEIVYPSYFETHLTDWLNDIDSLITIAQANNPYTAMTAYDPAARLAAMDGVAGLALTTGGTFDPEVEWDVLYSQADTNYTTDFDSAYVDGVVDAMEDDQEVTHMAGVSRFVAGMSEINAVMTSSFIVGMGQLEQEFVRSLNRARVDLIAEFERRRPQFVAQSAGQMAEMFLQQRNLYMQASQMNLDYDKAGIIAEKEQTDMENQFDVDAELWSLELYKYGSNMMAGPAGGTASTRSQSTTAQTALGGALSGAALGFQATGGAGGALLGGIGGLIAGLI